jgi:hypothetical protein
MVCWFPKNGRSTVTVERRLQKLETVAAAHADGEEPNTRWLTAVPLPVQRYVAELVDEYWTLVDAGHDEDSAVDCLLARHPLYRPLQALLVTAATLGGRTNLRRIQAHLLYIAGKKLPFFPCPDPRWYRWRLTQGDYTTHLCARATLATLEERDEFEVKAWRVSGTTDAEVLAAAGIGALEAELLAADEKIHG